MSVPPGFDSQRTFLQKTSITLVARAIIFALSFVSSVVLARLLGPSGKGAYALLTLVPVLVAQMANLGLEISNVYFLGKRRASIGALAENSLGSSLVLGLSLLTLFWINRNTFAPILFKNIDPRMASLAMFSLPFQFLFVYFTHIVLGLERMVEYNISNILKPAAFLVMFGALYFFLADKFLAAVLSWLTAIILATSIAIIFVGRITPFGFRFHPNLFRRSVSFGIKGYLANVLNILNYRFDVVLCNLFLTKADVGYYSIAVLLAEILWFIPNTLALLLFPRTAAGDRHQTDQLAQRLCRITLVFTCFSALILLVFGDVLIRVIFSKKFLPALRPLWILLPGTIMLSVGKLFNSYIVGRGRPIITTYAALVALVVNTLLNLWLIPRWGIAGAAFSSTVSYSLTFIFLLVAFQRISEVKFSKTLLIQKNDFSLYRDLLQSLGKGN